MALKTHILYEISSVTKTKILGTFLGTPLFFVNLVIISSEIEV